MYNINSTDWNHDGQYDLMMECHWVIVAGDDELIEFNLLKMDIEYEEMCAYDYIKVGSYDASLVDVQNAF